MYLSIPYMTIRGDGVLEEMEVYERFHVESQYRQNDTSRLAFVLLRPI